MIGLGYSFATFHEGDRRQIAPGFLAFEASLGIVYSFCFSRCSIDQSCLDSLDNPPLVAKGTALKAFVLPGHLPIRKVQSHEGQDRFEMVQDIFEGFLSHRFDPGRYRPSICIFKPNPSLS